MDKKEAEKILEASKQSYEKIAREFSETRAHFWPELAFIKNYLPKNGKVLDIGCGNGRLLELLGETTLGYTGVDFSKNMLQEAQQLHSDKKFVLADALNLPFPDQSFDAVVSLATLHHIPSKEFQRQFFKEAARVLAKNGVLIITAWDLWRARFLPYFIKSFLGKISGNKLDWGDLFLTFGKHQETRYLHAFTEKRLAQLAKEIGFNVKILHKIKNTGGQRSNILLIAIKN
ncbi:MAG: methyltransferase domain-containing protein [Candidatus Niyogibacteria bacterium]|nr:methyltransferase domain-containing protein [Candidatus Niyogibacteria bacterium]